MRLFAFPSVIALAAAQGLLSLPPALQSFADGFQSLVDPSSHAQTTPTAATPSPKTTASPAPAPPPVTTTSESSSIVPTSSSSALTTTSSSQTSSSTISSTNTPTTRSTTWTRPAESASAPTETSSSSTSSGLSHQAKVGIGVGVGVFIFVGLLAAALYSFVRDRRASEAYAAWRERKSNKHGRLDSTGSPSSFTGGAEKVMELRRVEHGDGTFRTQAAPYTMPASSQSSQSLDKELPAPPAAYQQPQQIKRKEVPGSTPQRPRFSWMD